MKHQNAMFTVLLASTLALFATASANAQAVIDQKRALAGNVTPDDTSGFPITLSVPGSYKLTGNLVVPAGVNGIEINASGVTLDLNGFSISGPITCVRDMATSAVACNTGPTTSKGIAMNGGGNTVRNGTVRGFAYGILYAGADQIDGMLIEQNQSGVAAPNHQGARTLVRNSRAQFNQYTGFGVADAMVQGCTAGGNGGAGFTATRSVVLDSVAFNNRMEGFKGNNLALGRSVAQGNLGGNVTGYFDSLGGNLNGSTVY